MRIAWPARSADGSFSCTEAIDGPRVDSRADAIAPATEEGSAVGTATNHAVGPVYRSDGVCGPSFGADIRLEYL
jgi:hypothetical protein